MRSMSAKMRTTCRFVVVLGILGAPAAYAQLTDLTQTPNVENAGIAKSLSQQIGAGVGNVTTPNSSIFIIKRDPAVRRRLGP